MRRAGIIVASMVLLSTPYGMHAHEGGVSHERVIGNYAIDIGYDLANPIAGDRLIFDFDLKSVQASSSIDFDYVWVRLQDDTTTRIATAVANAEFGPTTLLYTIPESFEGDLRVHARYQKGDDALVEESFTIPVQPRETPLSDYLPFGVSFVAGFLTGLAISLVAAKLVRKKSSM